MPHYKTEFPDFDWTVVMPPGFTDVSYHNNACPSWLRNGTDVEVLVNYRNPALRELPGAFTVISYAAQNTDDAVTLYEGADLEEAVRIALAVKPYK